MYTKLCYYHPMINTSFYVKDKHYIEQRVKLKHSVVFIINTPFGLKEILKLLSRVFIYQKKKNSDFLSLKFFFPSICKIC